MSKIWSFVNDLKVKKNHTNLGDRHRYSRSDWMK